MKGPTHDQNGIDRISLRVFVIDFFFWFGVFGVMRTAVDFLDLSKEQLLLFYVIILVGVIVLTEKYMF